MLKHSCASWKWSGNLLLFLDIPLGVIRILDQTRPLLLVLEHASASWLASAEDSYHGSKVLYPRTTSILDRCCKSKGYFLKKSCFLAPDAFGSSFWSLWGSCHGHFGHLHRPRCLPDCSQSAQHMSMSVQEASCQCQLNINSVRLYNVIVELLAQQCSTSKCDCRIACSSLEAPVCK